MLQQTVNSCINDLTLTVLLFLMVDSVKSALSTQVLEGTVTEWPLRSLTSIHLSDIDETDTSDEVYLKSNRLV